MAAAPVALSAQSHWFVHFSLERRTVGCVADKHRLLGAEEGAANADHGHVTVEGVVSGPGLADTYRFLEATAQVIAHIDGMHRC
jgi:hypothetical protein